MEESYLLKIGQLLSTSCPPASRYFMSNLHKRLHECPELLKNRNVPLYCMHCCSIRNSANFKIIIKPPQIVNRHIKKLIKTQNTTEWKLSMKQKKKLKKYYNSSSKIIYKCLICDHNSVQPGTKMNKIKTITTTTTSTPKIKRSDINAGLFIPSIITRDNKKSNLDKSEISSDNSINMVESSDNSCGSSNISNNTDESMRNSSRSDSSLASFQVSSELNSKKQSSAKKKKTLLAQILDQEQNKKKKKTLSSFLVSL